jgi:hypothetical protein
MTKSMGAGVVSTLLTAVLALTGCTGGQEGTAAEETAPQANSIESPQAETVNAREVLGSINPAIPVYAGARFRDDLTRRDSVMIRSRYGSNAQVYTLATNDSFPQVYHYYTTYLAQFRAFPSQDTYPPERKDWRTLEVQLNQAMQDSFIPGKELDPNGKQVTLQIAETEAEPKTVIRYIVTDRPAVGPAAPVAVASQGSPTAPVAR